MSIEEINEQAQKRFEEFSKMEMLTMKPTAEHQIIPVPKPRMTQRDRWAKRPAVLRYRAFCDEVRARGITVPESGAHVVFVLPMPKSWSKRKRAEMDGQPHRQKPDVDNLTKSVLDAIYDDDSGVWDIRTSKRWGEQGKIIISTGADQ